MHLRMAFSLFLSMTPDHNHNPTLYLLGPPGMFGDDELHLPALPPGTVRETNSETLRRLGHDLSLISRQELSAVGAYRLYLPVDGERSSWGYVLEAARVSTTNEVLLLFRNDEGDGIARSLRWLPLSLLCTVTQAKVSYQVSYEGPAEEVMWAILHVFHDAFEFATDTNWSYVKRLEFYHSFPFEGLPTVDAGCSHDQLIQTVAKRWFLTVGPTCIVAGMLERSSMYVALLVAVWQVVCISERFETVYGTTTYLL